MKATFPLQLLVVLLLGALLYLPSMGSTEMDHEEARRAIPAREMLASGDFVVPTIWGRPYLTKPPLYFWAIAGCAGMRGIVDEVSARLPSVLATLATAVLVLVTGTRLFGPPSGLIAALLFLVSFGVFEKGALGELEALFGLTVCAATYALVPGTSKPRTWLFTSLALGAALLTKGPPALVFFGCAAFWAVRLRAPGARSPWPVIIGALLVGSLLLAAWGWLVLDDPRVQGAVDTWRRELSREGGSVSYWSTRVEFLSGALAAFFPSSFILLACLRSKSARELRGSRPYRFLLWSTVTALLVFAVLPGSQPRYVYPLIPSLCLLAAPFVAATRDVRPVGILVGLMGLTVFVGGCVLWFRPIAGVEKLEPVGHVLLLLVLGAALSTFTGWRVEPSRRPLLACLAVLVCARMIQLTQVVPQTANRNRRVENAQALERYLPPDEVVRTDVWDAFNVFFYLSRPLRWIDTAEETAPGEWVIVRADTIYDSEVFERVHQMYLHRGPRIALLQRR